MTNPFEYLDYRDYFRDEITARKRMDSSINFQNMAAAIRVQKPFLSKVVHGHNHLTQDQLYLACLYMKLSAEETSFIELSRDLQTSSLKIRLDKLEQEIKGIQKKMLETDYHLNTTRIKVSDKEMISEYYLDPIYQLVHVAASIDRYSCDFRKIAHDLLIPVARVAAAIDKLEELQVLKREGSRLKVITHNLHLPRSAKEYKAWSSQLRLAGLSRAQNLPADESYGFSVVFSTSEEVRKEIQEHFLRFIKDIQELSANASEDNVYQLNFDLFNWNSPVC